MKEQIEEMAKDLGIAFQLAGTTRFGAVAEVLVNAGYRKQSEGEWVVTYKNDLWYYDCPFCGGGYAQESKLPASNYCENCGAELHEPKTKGGA